MQPHTTFAMVTHIFKGERRHHQTVHLGGAGLGLVALLKVEAAHPGTTSRKILMGLGRFLPLMQHTDGSFYTRYNRDQVGLGWLDDSSPSLYYPGEAALALVMLYQWNGDRQ